MPDDPPTYLALAEARQHFPGRPAVQTLWRWAIHGVRRRGQVIKLPYLRVGSRLFLTKEGIAKFLDELHAVDEAQEMPPPPPLLPPRTATRRARDIQQAERRLAMAGI